MNPIDISLLIVSAASFTLALLIYFKNPKNIVNFSFALFVLNGALWPLAIALFRISSDYSNALFWDRMIYVSGTLVPSTFLNFAYIFVHKRNPKLVFQLINLLVVPFVFIYLLCTTPLWIETLSVLPQGKIVILGPLYIVWMAYFGSIMGVGTIILYGKYKKSSGIDRAQLRYMLLSVVFPVLGAFPFNILFPLFGNYQLIAVGPFFLTSMILVISYAIIKHRMFDVRFALRHFLVFLIDTTLTMVLLSTLATGYGYFTNSQLSVSVYIFIFFVSLVLVFIIEKIHMLSQKIASDYFFQSIYDYQTTLLDLSKNLSTVIEMPKLVDLIINTLMQTMKVDRAAVLVRDFHSRFLHDCITSKPLTEPDKRISRIRLSDT